MVRPAKDTNAPSGDHCRVTRARSKPSVGSPLRIFPTDYDDLTFVDIAPSRGADRAGDRHDNLPVCFLRDR